MRRALLVVAILGALAWLAEVALLFLLPQVAQSSAYVVLATTDGYLEWIVPVLGVIVGILGTVQTARGGATAWLTLFITFTVLIVVLPAFGFLVALLTVFSSDRTLEAVGGVALEVSLLFPIVMFVTALISSVRSGTRPGKA